MANSGGVYVSCLEWRQGRTGSVLDSAEVDLDRGIRTRAKAVLEDMRQRPGCRRASAYAVARRILAEPIVVSDLHGT
jgi:glutamate dehydrogenase/leucine dehydrogenase